MTMSDTLCRLAASGTLVFAVTAFASVTAQTPSERRRVPLEQTYWKAIELAGKPVPAHDRTGEASLVLDGRRVSGSDGCNRISGGYTASGGDITFGQIAGTEMACPGGADVARAFRDALAGASRLTVNAGKLTLFNASGAKLAIFEAAEPPAAPKPAAPPPLPKPAASSPLNGTGWQLVKFEAADGKAIVPDLGAKYAFELASGGRVRARVDCNRGTGTWTSNGTTQIQFGALALTRARCPAGSMHDQIVANWTKIRSYSLRLGHLFLTTMDGGTYEFEPVAPAATSKQ